MTQITPPTEPGPIKPQHTFSATGLANTSVILGTVGLVSSCFWCISIPCAILAICFGIISKNRFQMNSGKAMAKAGIICGVITLGASIIVMIINFFMGDNFITFK